MVAGCQGTPVVDTTTTTGTTDTTTTTTTDTTTTTVTGTADTTTPTAVNTTLIDQVKTIKEEGYVKGNPDARFTIIEYSDIECPFCKQHNANGTLQKVLTTYPNDVNMIFRHFPLSFHPHAQKAAEAAECVAELAGGAETFYKFLDMAFALSDLGEVNLISAAKGMGADETKFKDCLTSGKFATKVMNQQTEGATLFGVNGTPGNVIFDNQSGKFVLVAGAYPFDKFDQEIKAMMK